MSCAEGPSGCPGTYIEQNDLRHPANAVDDKLTAYFGHPQNTIDPNILPVETGELTFGLDHELSHSMFGSTIAVVIGDPGLAGS